MSAVSRHKYQSLITEVLCMLMFFYTAGNHSKWRKVGEIFTVGFSPSVRWPSGNGESPREAKLCVMFPDLTVNKISDGDQEGV